MPPLVTIGIPCYNSQQWVASCVASAIAQTHASIEIIVVDDGSSDGSLQALEPFAAKIRLIRNSHQGANIARNTILREARGEWIQYLDADDTLQPEKIARQLAESAGVDADVLYSPVITETWGRGELGETWTDPIDSDNDLFCQWFLWQLPQTGGALWHKKALAKINGWNTSMPCCQEHELYLRALQKELRFYFCPTANAVYRLWSEQTLCRKNPTHTIRVRSQLIDSMAEWLRANSLWTKKHRHAAGRSCFEMARTLAGIDRTAGNAYFHQRQQRGLIHLSGPAAPLSYRLICKLLGFSQAENIAATRRRS